MTPPVVQSKADAIVGRVGVKDVVGALVGKLVGYTMREELEGAKGR